MDVSTVTLSKILNFSNYCEALIFAFLRIDCRKSAKWKNVKEPLKRIIENHFTANPNAILDLFKVLRRICSHVRPSYAKKIKGQCCGYCQSINYLLMTFETLYRAPGVICARFTQRKPIFSTMKCDLAKTTAKSMTPIMEANALCDCMFYLCSFWFSHCKFKNKKKQEWIVSKRIRFRYACGLKQWNRHGN